MSRQRVALLSDEDYATFRAELVAFREAMALSQAAAANLIGAHEYTWARWERAERRPPAHVAAGVRALLKTMLNEREERERVRGAVAAHRARKAAG